MTELRPTELTDAELDLVAAGTGPGNSMDFRADNNVSAWYPGYQHNALPYIRVDINATDHSAVLHTV